MVKCDCGNVFPAVLSEWIGGRHKACFKCSRKYWEKPFRDRTGERVRDLTIIGMEGEWRGELPTKYRVRCERCGGVSVMDGAHLRYNKMCEKCAEKNLEDGRAITMAGFVTGTNAVHIKSIMDGRRIVNRNSSTGVTGVNKFKDKYRAVIMFRRKQYSLGLYNNIEDAAAARKEAEKHIYGDFLEWYENSRKEEAEDE